MAHAALAARTAGDRARVPRSRRSCIAGRPDLLRLHGAHGFRAAHARCGLPDPSRPALRAPGPRQLLRPVHQQLLQHRLPDRCGRVPGRHRSSHARAHDLRRRSNRSTRWSSATASGPRLAARPAARTLVGGWAAAAALAATLPALVYAYELIGSIKEITALGLILTLGALVVVHPRWLRGGPRAAIPFALVVAGGVSALGVAFGAWTVGPVLVLAGVFIAERPLTLRAVGRLGALAGSGLGVLVVAAWPSWQDTARAAAGRASGREQSKPGEPRRASARGPGVWSLVGRQLPRGANRSEPDDHQRADRCDDRRRHRRRGAHHAIARSPAERLDGADGRARRRAHARRRHLGRCEDVDAQLSGLRPAGLGRRRRAAASGPSVGRAGAGGGSGRWRRRHRRQPVPRHRPRAHGSERSRTRLDRHPLRRTRPRRCSPAFDEYALCCAARPRRRRLGFPLPAARADRDRCPPRREDRPHARACCRPARLSADRHAPRPRRRSARRGRTGCSGRAPITVVWGRRPGAPVPIDRFRLTGARPVACSRAKAIAGVAAARSATLVSASPADVVRIDLAAARRTSNWKHVAIWVAMAISPAVCARRSEPR